MPEKEVSVRFLAVTSTSALDFEALVSVVNSLLIILLYHMMVLKLFLKILSVTTSKWLF